MSDEISSTVRCRDLERLLLSAERTISLIDRCRPRNADTEQARLLAAWRRGVFEPPRFVYAPSVDLSALCQGLSEVAERALSFGPWGDLYAARAQELAREAEIVSHVGTAGLVNAARLRFHDPVGHEASQAASWANEWARLPTPERNDLGASSDDPRDPASLLSAMRSAVGEHRLPFRVVARPLMSAAATGDGVIVVRSGGHYRADEVRRIVVHEVEGHALPRARARAEAIRLFALGTAGGTDDEEGRALLLEERAGCFGDRRRAELGRRHLAALALRAGADWVETVRLLLDLGAPVASALAVASRVHRGGGLAREVVYLPALARIRHALEIDPSLERWLERGRIALSAIVTLKQLGDPPESLGSRRAA